MDCNQCCNMPAAQTWHRAFYWRTTCISVALSCTYLDPGVFVSVSCPHCSLLLLFFPGVHPDGDKDILKVSAELDDGVFKKVWNPLKHAQTRTHAHTHRHTRTLKLHSDFHQLITSGDTVHKQQCQMGFTSAQQLTFRTYFVHVRVRNNRLLDLWCNPLVQRVLRNRLGNAFPSAAWQEPEETSWLAVPHCMDAGS